MPRQIDQRTRIDAAIFLPSLEGGGAERTTVDLANCLAREGYKIDLVLASATGPFVEIIGAEVNVVDLKARSVAWALPGFVAYLRKVKPTALLSAMTHANVIAILAHTLSRQRLFLAVSERGSPRQGSITGGASLRQRLSMSMARYLYRRADLVITVANALNSDVAELFRVPQDRISTIYNGVFKSDIDVLAKAPSPHSWLDGNGVPVILAVGRLSREKGMDILIKAFALARARRPCRLIIYGEGTERTALEAQVRETGYADDIALPGFIANPLAAMARASLFVLPSRSEGLPGALIQAMACGTPVVATSAAGGAAEILEGGKWGLLVGPEDACAMSDALLRGLDKPLSVDIRSRAAEFSEGRAANRYAAALGLSRAREAV